MLLIKHIVSATPTTAHNVYYVKYDNKAMLFKV